MLVCPRGETNEWLIRSQDAPVSIRRADWARGFARTRRLKLKRWAIRKEERFVTGKQMVPPENVRRRYDEVLGASQAIALDTLFALRTCVQGIDTVVARWLGPDALTPGRFQILATLWAADGVLPQREIVKRLDVTRATVSALISVLETDGLIKTVPDAADKRQVSVALTAEGTALIARLVAETTANLRRAFAALDDEELAALVKQIGRLTQSVNALSDGK